MDFVYIIREMPIALLNLNFDKFLLQFYLERLQKAIEELLETAVDESSCTQVQFSAINCNIIQLRLGH